MRRTFVYRSCVVICASIITASISLSDDGPKYSGSGGLISVQTSGSGENSACYSKTDPTLRITCQFPKGFPPIVKSLENKPKSFSDLKSYEAKFAEALQKPAECRYQDNKGSFLETKEGKVTAQTLDDKGNPVWRVVFTSGEYIECPQ